MDTDCSLTVRLSVTAVMLTDTQSAHVLAALGVWTHGRTGGLIYKRLHLLTKLLSRPTMYNYIYTLYLKPDRFLCHLMQL